MAWRIPTFALLVGIVGALAAALLPVARAGEMSPRDLDALVEQYFEADHAGRRALEQQLAAQDELTDAQVAEWKPKLLKPKKIYRFQIDLWPTAWRFAAGHRLRVAITSSNFPRFDRNLNTGENAAFSSEIEIAANSVYHEKKYPSHLTVRVMT